MVLFVHVQTPEHVDPLPHFHIHHDTDHKNENAANIT